MKYTLLVGLVLAMSSAASMAVDQQRVWHAGAQALSDPHPSGGCPALQSTITSLPFASSGANNCDGTDNINVYTSGVCNTVGYPGPNELFQINIGTSSNMVITLSTVQDLGVFLVSNCANGTSCIGFADVINAGIGSTTENNVVTVSPGGGATAQSIVSPAAGVYYLYVDSYYATPDPGSCGDYNLSVTGTLPAELTKFSID